jgi:tetratricopeptide (TPR) repeat protein
MTLWGAFRDSAVQIPLTCTVVGLFEIYQIYCGNWLFALLAAAALLIYLSALFCIRLPSMYHKRLLKALDWHRWDEALRLVDRLRWMNRLHFLKVPAIALIRYRAKALSGAGELSQALEEYAVCENLPGCPSWLYKTMVADIYDTAKMHNQALDLVKQSLAQQPRSSVYIGLATRLLRCKANLAEVKEALAEAEKGPLVEDIERPLVIQCHGVVAYLENDLQAAEKDFRAALEIYERTRHIAFRDGHISRTKGRLCCVLAKRGDMNGARIYFEAAEKYLVATQSSELLEECKASLGKA